jgi:hypothetical protein
MWLLAGILLVALMIPVIAILVDSPLGRSVARRLEARGEGGGAGGSGTGADVRQLQQKVDLLETELDDLNRSVAGMRDELQFMQRLLEDPARKQQRS